MRVALALLVAAVPAAGCFDDRCDRPVCAEDVPDAAPGSEWDVEHSFVLPGEEFAEAQVEMAAGSELVLGFDARPEMIDWNVHSHQGEVIQHLEGTDTNNEYTFVAPDDGYYFPMWQNSSEAALNITVRLRLADGDRLVNWY